MMADYRYDFLGDKFLTYKNVEEPEVELDLPLFNDSIDISDWASGVTEDGNILVKPSTEFNLEQWVFNNPEYVPQQVEQLRTEQSTEPVLQAPTQLTSTLPIQQVSFTRQSTLSKNQQERALLIMNGLVSRGINPVIASGIIGNLVGESGYNLNTSAYNSNDVGAPAGGLAGYRGDRFIELKNFAKSRGKKWTDLDTLLDYLVSTIPSDVSNRLSKATNPFEASEAWAYYEKYAGYNNSIESARKFQRSQGWSDQKTKDWIANQHKKRGDMSTDIYNLWLANL